MNLAVIVELSPSFLFLIKSELQSHKNCIIVLYSMSISSSCHFYWYLTKHDEYNKQIKNNIILLRYERLLGHYNIYHILSLLMLGRR